MFAQKVVTLATVAGLASLASCQSFQRLGGCPKLGCIFPPDQSDFLAGQYFDIRLEVHAPQNGSERINRGPDENFRLEIVKNEEGARPQIVSQYFDIDEPSIERWNFTWFEDYFARDARTPSLVNVAAKAYRKVALYEAGEYTATLSYYGNQTTVATWTVRDLDEERKTKNVLVFIGDGMTTNMITAARLMAHKSVNGKYQSRMAMDKFPVLGHQMTHSMDSFITDSANSATTLFAGHKTSTGCLGVWADSSPTPLDDPKMETMAELFQRIYNGHIGIVSTAFIADATPAAMNAHVRDRDRYGNVIEGFLRGITNYTWVDWAGFDVIFGGGAEQFFNSTRGGATFQDRDYYVEFANAGYQIAQDKDQLAALSDDERALGIFSVSNMAKWVDRNIYPQNLVGLNNSADGLRGDAVNQPGLKEMTIKAIDILNNRAGDDGWMLMSEAASIDKMMHVLDYDRALGELLELDDTIKTAMEHLEAIGELENTLIVVTADHGHGFDVAGSVDTKYLAAQNTTRAKRGAVGVYEQSGLSQYTEGSLQYSEGTHFPANWSPRYTLFEGFMANPDRRENYSIALTGPRSPATNSTPARNDYIANGREKQNGILINGTLPVSANQGVHSLTDVPVFAMGPCQELFGGVYNSPDIFFGIADCLGLSEFNTPGERGYGRH